MQPTQLPSIRQEASQCSVDSNEDFSRKIRKYENFGAARRVMRQIGSEEQSSSLLGSHLDSMQSGMGKEGETEEDDPASSEFRFRTIDSFGDLVRASSRNSGT